MQIDLITQKTISNKWFECYPKTITVKIKNDERTFKTKENMIRLDVSENAMKKGQW